MLVKIASFIGYWFKKKKLFESPDIEKEYKAFEYLEFHCASQSSVTICWIMETKAKDTSSKEKVGPMKAFDLYTKKGKNFLLNRES